MVNMNTEVCNSATVTPHDVAKLTQVIC